MNETEWHYLQTSKKHRQKQLIVQMSRSQNKKSKLSSWLGGLGQFSLYQLLPNLQHVQTVKDLFSYLAPFKRLMIKETDNGAFQMASCDQLWKQSCLLDKAPARCRCPRGLPAKMSYGSLPKLIVPFFCFVLKI